jgi:hypothetical protein
MGGPARKGRRVHAGWTRRRRARGASGLVLGLVLWLGTPSHALAWSDHAVLTRLILRSAAWLDQWRDLEVTPWTYEKADTGPYAPLYTPVYVDRLVGERTSAREVLLRYVEEPDWGMDDGLQVSPFQGLFGGSQSYRHRSSYFAQGALRFGRAPERCKSSYEMAAKAFENRDPYWGFRYLARALHYLQDLGEPYEIRPFLPVDLVLTQASGERLGTMSTNLRIHYEALVAHHLHKQEDAGRGPWLEAIRDATAATVLGPGEASRALADFTADHAVPILEACNRFWPRRARSQKRVQAVRPRDLDPPELPPSWVTIEERTTLQLHVTAKIVRGLLEKARKEVAIVPAPVEE